MTVTREPTQATRLVPLVVMDQDPSVRAVTVRVTWQVSRPDGEAGVVAFDITVSRALVQGALCRTWTADLVMGELALCSIETHAGAVAAYLHAVRVLERSLALEYPVVTRVR